MPRNFCSISRNPFWDFTSTSSLCKSKSCSAYNYREGFLQQLPLTMHARIPTRNSHRWLLQEVPSMIAPGSPSVDSPSNSHLALLQEFQSRIASGTLTVDNSKKSHRRLLQEFPPMIGLGSPKSLGISLGIPTDDWSRKSHRWLLLATLLGIPPWDSFWTILQEFPFGTPPGVSFVDSYWSSLWGFLQ